MKSCLFCRIVSGEVKSDIIYENDVLIVPKKHFSHLVEMVESEEGRTVLNDITKVLPDIVRSAGLENRGFRLVNNCKEEGGQTVPHVHFHLIGGKSLSRELP
jgi:histidine triad (HIT) family protein